MRMFARVRCLALLCVSVVYSRDGVASLISHLSHAMVTKQASACATLLMRHSFGRLAAFLAAFRCSFSVALLLPPPLVPPPPSARSGRLRPVVTAALAASDAHVPPPPSLGTLRSRSPDSFGTGGSGGGGSPAFAAAVGGGKLTTSCFAKPLLTSHRFFLALGKALMSEALSAAEVSRTTKPSPLVVALPLPSPPLRSRPSSLDVSKPGGTRIAHRSTLGSLVSAWSTYGELGVRSTIFLPRFFDDDDAPTATGEAVSMMIELSVCVSRRLLVGHAGEEVRILREAES